MQQLFAAGKLAMNMAGPYTLPEYEEAGVEYGVVSLPSFTGEHTTISGPDTWAVFDNGEAREKAAMEFLKWFTRTEAAAAMADRLRQPAADQERRRRRPASPNTRTASPGSKQFIENTQTGADAADGPAYPEISQAMGKAVAEVLYGKADAQAGAGRGGRRGQPRTRTGG